MKIDLNRFILLDIIYTVYYTGYGNALSEF